MATLCEFGTAPQQKKGGYKMVGVITSTKRELKDTYQDKDIRFVPGPVYPNGFQYEFAVMIKK